MTQSNRFMDDAIDWHVRLTGDDADWDGFILWLEADPAHREAYDAVVRADDRLSELLPSLGSGMGANDDDAGVSVPSRWRPAGIAAAVTVFLASAALLWQAQSPASEIYTTGPTQSRTIALADGATIHMDRNSTLQLTRGEVNRVTLEKGAAFFDAPPDPDPSFDVRVGTYRVQDIGTEFGVTRGAQELQVQVAQGTVRIGPQGGNSLPLTQGRGLLISERSGRMRAFAIAPSQVSSWRSGQLAYEDIPVSVVIADLQRSSGLTITVDPRIADTHFTGVLMIGDGTRLVSDFSSLTGFVAEKRGKAVHFSPAR